MRAETFAFAAIVAIGAALVPSTAEAFCRTRTIPVPSNFDPATSASGCFDQGAPLYHASQCLPFHLLAAESPRISRAVLSDAVGRAFGAWTAQSTTCAPGITAIELTPVSNEKIVDYKTGERGHNVFGVVDGPWPHAGGGDTLSLATLTFNADTGEIYDADLEIRSDVDYGFGPTLKPDAYDFESVITHEAGHLLGLAHTQDNDAVMFPNLTPGSITQRKLSADDERAICAIYPNRQTRNTGSTIIASTSCDLSPVTPGNTPATCGDANVTNGCSVASLRAIGRSEPSWFGLLATLGFAGLLGARARRRRR